VPLSCRATRTEVTGESDRIYPNPAKIKPFPTAGYTGGASQNFRGSCMDDSSKPSGPESTQSVVRHLRLFARLSLQEYGALFQKTVNAWIEDKAPRLGASLAFYTLLSLAPLLIVVVAVAALVYGQQAAQGQLVWEIQGLVGADGARTIQGLIHSAYKPGSGTVATVLGVLTLIFGASTVVVELRDALNTIWRVPAPEASSGLQSVLRFMRERFYSFGLILGVGFLLMVSLHGRVHAAAGVTIGPPVVLTDCAWGRARRPSCDGFRCF
jgi:hypothetical protein